MKKTYAILNAVFLIAVITLNYVAGSQGVDGNTVGSISDEYRSLFTPAGYAFSIWGIIYVFLAINVIHQLRMAFSSSDGGNYIERLGPWLLIANVGNGSWLFLWLTQNIALSVVVMLVILLSLIIAMFKLNLQKDKPPLSYRFQVEWPMSIYLGWISVATIANIASWFVSMDWHIDSNEALWAMIMIGVAVLLNVFMVINRDMITFGLVGIWSLLAIASRHWGVESMIQWTAITGTVIIGIFILFRLFSESRR